MKTITDVGPCYEKLVNECRKVLDRGSVWSFQILIDLGRRKVPYIDKIMTKEKGTKEEKESANKDAEELF